MISDIKKRITIINTHKTVNNYFDSKPKNLNEHDVRFYNKLLNFFRNSFNLQRILLIFNENKLTSCRDKLSYH